MRAQHLDTTFGRLWLVLNPLMLAGVYFVLVDIIRKGPTRGADFLAHLIAGIFAYYFVSGSVREGARTVTRRGKLVLNTAFPRILLPISSMIGHFMRFLPTLGIFAVIHVIVGLPISATLLLVVPLVVLFAAGRRSGCRCSSRPLRSTSATSRSSCPTCCASGCTSRRSSTSPTRCPHRYHVFIWLNPIGALLTAWSDVLIEGKAPSLFLWAVASGWAVGLVIVGGLFFMSRERDFAVRL